MKSATEIARKKLILALSITGLSMNAMSKAIGVADTTLSRLKNADNPPEPRASTMEGIDKIVSSHIKSGNATPEQIKLYEESYKSGAVVIAPANTTAPEEINRRFVSDFQTDERTIPVLGTAAGSTQGSFEIGFEQDPIDHVRRPPNLAGVKDIYAIIVVGESMVPEHKPGDLRIIHPRRPALPGDSVVIQTYDPATGKYEAFIKCLISMNSREIRCYQHNPRMQFTYTKPNSNPELNNTQETYAIKIHKVLSMNELHGL